MAVVLFGDVYATVAQADVALAGNAQWRGLDNSVPDKEALLKQAARTFDDATQYSGTKVSDVQPMEFPRDMGYGEWYSQERQTINLRVATMAQLEHILATREIGNAQYASSPGVASPNRYPSTSAKMAPQALSYLRGYMRNPL